MTERDVDLTRLLDEFDSRSDGFSEHEVTSSVSELIRAGREAGREPNLALRAESMAFGFVENYTHEATGWGTYYGPMMTGTNEAGQGYETPSIRLVTPEMIEYWESRSAEAQHPTLVLRYADLVWDFSPTVCEAAANIELARRIVDSTVRLSQLEKHRFEASLVTELKRALSIAISINDKDRVARVRDAILSFEARVEDDTRCGLWGFSFDSLVENKRVELSSEAELSLVNALEQRLTRFANPEGGGLDPHGAEAAAMRLARYYNRSDRRDDARRVLLTYSVAFQQAAKEAEPLVASAWLQKVYEVLHQHGLHQDADELESRIREFGRRAVGQMKQFSTTVDIPKEKLDAYIQELTEGALGDALNRIAAHFTPRRAQVEHQLRDLAEKAPLQAHMPRAISDHDGRTIATVGSLEEDLEGRVVSQIFQNLQFESMFLEIALERLESGPALSAESLSDHMYESPVFPAEHRPTVESGLGAYFRGDYLAACSILIPQVEAAIRRLLVEQDSPAYRPGRNGSLRLRTLDEMLRDQAVSAAFGEDVALYLRVLLTDQRGWNLRNSLCHGFFEPGAIDRRTANRILHILLILALARRVEPGVA